MASAFIYFLVGVAVALLIALRRKRNPAPLPPGPPAEPFIGHVRVFPKSRQANAFIELGKRYGDVLYFNMIGQSIIVLNNYEDAFNLLDKRSTNYSDRPDCTTQTLMGYSGLSSLIRYNDRWRRHRRLLQEKLLAKNCDVYRDIQSQNTKVLLRTLRGFQGNCNPALTRYTASIALEIAYGHRVQGSLDDDDYIKTMEVALVGLGAAALGTNVVDVLPFLQHVPSWVPVLSAFTAVSRKYRPAVDAMFNKPFSDVLQRMKSGVAASCYVTEQIAKQERQGTLSPLILQDIKDSAATMYSGGSDTTWASLSTFINAMVINPDIQRKAQKEIDQLTGGHRLPDFSDRERLPYIACLLQEVIRWNPVSTGGPHRSVHDDVYNGMFIPAGTLVLPNSIAMNHDERLYRDPHKFYPDRFLPQPEGYGEENIVATFGFGRRICPGRHLASASLYIALVRILAVFDITNVVRDGSVVEVKYEFTDTILSRPENFECAFKPRSTRAERLLNDFTSEE